MLHGKNTRPKLVIRTVDVIDENGRDLQSTLSTCPEMPCLTITSPNSVTRDNVPPSRGMFYSDHHTRFSGYDGDDAPNLYSGTNANAIMFAPPTPSLWGDYYGAYASSCLTNLQSPKLASFCPFSLKRSLEEEVQSYSEGNSSDATMDDSTYKWEPTTNRIEVKWDNFSCSVEDGSKEARQQKKDESITTMMVRNLPRRVTQEQLEVHLQNSGFLGEYDVLYLPYCFKKKQNLGYAFINFRTSAKAFEFCCSWHKKKLNNGPKSRPMNVTVAQIQGRDANLNLLLKEHKMRNNPDLQPIIYDENGNRITYGPYIAQHKLQ